MRAHARPGSTARIGGLFILAAVLLFGQDWNTATVLPNVDFAGLTPAQKTKVLKLLRDNNCTCGCGMKMAECRMKDPNCSYSKNLAALVIDSVKHGKTDAETIAAVKASQWGKDHSLTLEDPVTIPVADAPVRGPGNARITLVEFSDFQCPFCVAATPQLDTLLKAYPSQVKLIFKEFPLDSHSQAALAAAAALAAHKQGKFWQLHDAMFSLQGNLSRNRIIALANGLGLDMKRFQADLDSPEIKRAVAKEISEGEHIGVDSTPTLFVDGRRFNGALTVAGLKPIIDDELKHPAKVADAAGR
jgi:protein-disulfide isomerase